MTATTAPARLTPAQIIASMPPLAVITNDLSTVMHDHPFARAFVAKILAHEPVSDAMRINAFRLWTSVGFTYTAPAPVDDVRRNKFPGSCELCGQMVAAGEGKLDRRSERGAWIIQHIDECPETPQVRLNGILLHTHEGRYAIPCIDDRNDLDFVFVTERKDGSSVIKRFVGGSSQDRYVEESIERQLIWAEKLASMSDVDLELAARRFGFEQEVCTDCGRALEIDDSRELGRGPKCLRKAREAGRV